jgi:undecaprenyl diphosphate synthase
VAKLLVPRLPLGTKAPDHIMIIPDGNRRWARARGLHTLEGHKAGFDATTDIAKAAREMGVHTLSLWGFSTENWDREISEVDYLMRLYAALVDKHIKEAMRDQVRIIHLGRKDRLPKFLINKISQAEEKTRNNSKHVLNICLDYGGRDEMLRAVQRIVNARVSGEDTREIDEKVFSSYLDTSDQPFPYVDLVIRTSGEQRTSGMLLWQAAYAEVYWELDHFPDFSPVKLREAVLDFSRRRRRFGGNDREEHLKFNPKLVAGLEVAFRRALVSGDGDRFRDLVVKYVKEHYGLSKDLAKKAGLSFSRALVCGRDEDWDEAKSALIELYDIVKKTLGLAFEPDMVATIEVDLWRGKDSKDKVSNRQERLQEWCAEKFRVSQFQASKAAHLASLAANERNLAELAQGDVASKHWEKAEWYMERYYSAIKDRVA